MSNNVEKMTTNVKGETENLKNKFSSLEANLKDLSSGGIFGQIEEMIQELKRLNEIKDQYELRYFLLCTELERRDKVIYDYTSQISILTSELEERDRHFTREIERIRQEEVIRTRETLQAEINSLKSSFQSEKSRLERRIQDLQSELTRKDNEVDGYKQKMLSIQETINRLKMENQDLLNKLQQGEKHTGYELNRLKSDHAAYIIELTNSHRNEMDKLRAQLYSENQTEITKQKTIISEYFSRQVSEKDNELQKMRGGFDSYSIRIQELERELNGLHNTLESRNRENADFKDQLITLKRSHEEYIIKITETHKIKLQQAMGEKEREMREKLEVDLSRLEKELKEKKNTILSLEQKIIYLTKENERNGQRLNDLIVERDELKSRLIEAEKRMGDEFRMLEETLTVQINEKDYEIERLLIQNRELQELYQTHVEQEKGRADALARENENLRIEINKLRELSEQRMREIENWKIKYSGYIPSDEADKMKDELSRLRRINMDNEEEIAKLKSDLARLNERMRSFSAELDTKDHELMNMNELCAKRKNEVINVQQENDKLMNMLRGLNQNKDNEDAKTMIFEENYVRMERDIQQLRNERDKYKGESERAHLSLQQVTKKMGESMMQHDDFNRSPRGSTTTHTTTIKSSQMYSSKIIDPNYRGEAFGK